MLHAAQRGVDSCDATKDVISPFCIEKRLGRELTTDDFTPVPANLPVLMGIRIGLDARWKHRSISAISTHSRVPRVEPRGGL
jgi:hypothetical protein